MANSISITAERDPELIVKLNAICEKRKPISLNTLAKQLLYESTDHLCSELGIQLPNPRPAIAG